MAENTLSNLFALLAEKKKSMEKGQEEMKQGQEEMKKGQEKMKEMKNGQDEMKKEIEMGQEEMKNLIRAEKEEMRAHVENQVEEMKEHVNRSIGKVEEDVQGVKREIDEFQEKISVLEQRISDLEIRPNNIPASPELMYSRPMVKSLTFDGQTSWTVFKTQFDVVSFAYGWNNRIKASQLVASHRGSAAEVLQGIPSDKLTDLTTIEKALEARFGDCHLTEFYRAELKTRRQNQGESLQVLAADVERLMSLAYDECPQDVRDLPISPVLCRRYQR
ncbi:hypothetical protein AVEN_160339-1 [Araneus ventricosus]|uniref:Retrotransposon gag domain-containing protein n=1 Tax=Araneus ventricosus TaxID=182803 RepID=A0A4Y2SW13_ARAVE|nr:hypothetical protein AVEN_160339-1 [Araneus ventricosus]